MQLKGLYKFFSKKFRENQTFRFFLEFFKNNINGLENYLISLTVINFWDRMMKLQQIQIKKNTLEEYADVS